MTRTAATTAFDDLADALRGRPPLEQLGPVEYAAGHALFESRSNQRANLTSWLVQHLADRAASPTRVLSIGCGDGSVDVAIAAALAGPGRRVDYVGIEPHAPSGGLFRDRLNAIESTRCTLLTDPFERASPEGHFDVVLAVHSLYYVEDLTATLRRACSLLAPGGELVILHAPREPLNTLVPMLCPGLRQPFADDVAQCLHTVGRLPVISRIDNRLDLTETGRAATDRGLLEFTVQAQLPSPLVTLVRAALAEHALPEAGLVLPHPVDALVVRARTGAQPPGQASTAISPSSFQPS